MPFLDKQRLLDSKGYLMFSGEYVLERIDGGGYLQVLYDVANDGYEIHGSETIGFERYEILEWHESQENLEAALAAYDFDLAKPEAWKAEFPGEAIETEFPEIYRAWMEESFYAGWLGMGLTDDLRRLWCSFASHASELFWQEPRVTREIITCFNIIEKYFDTPLNQSPIEYALIEEFLFMYAFDNRSFVKSESLLKHLGPKTLEFFIRKCNSREPDACVRHFFIDSQDLTIHERRTFSTVLRNSCRAFCRVVDKWFSPARHI